LAEAALLVVQLSESFAGLWGQLAGDLGLAICYADPGNGVRLRPEVAAVILAAGGAERAALEWFEGHEVPASVPVYAVGSDPGRRITSQLVGVGARDYFALPDDVEVLRSTVRAAVERTREDSSAGGAEAAGPKAEAFAALVGESPALRAALSRAARALPYADATALIIGETGTGKELLARAIHEGGPRKRAPFVTVNCSTLPANLIESELFGHERGAFTDAHASKPGLFEVADGGTLFLDEIGTLPVELQAKLLRVLEDRQVRRVGATRSRAVDVRIVAATNENLQEAVRAGTFRADLYFRLSVITLTLPPLRDRGNDVLLIAQVLLERLAPGHGLPVPSLDPDVRRALLAHRWPGNVRELKNAVERSLLLSAPGELSVEELLPESPPGDWGEAAAPLLGDGGAGAGATLDEMTARAARSVLAQCRGNRSQAARRLGISRARLRRLLGEPVEPDGPGGPGGPGGPA
jgi:DNA-binding NtrC family response regulator